MKHLFLACTVVAVVALFALIGCAEPEPVANNPGPKTPSASDSARNVVSSEPSSPGRVESSETKATGREINNATTNVGESNPGITIPVDSSDNGAVTSTRHEGAPREESSPVGDDGQHVAANQSDSVEESTEPETKFQLEFVSATGVEGLNPGDTIPNISGKDIDGIEFELSDYQGKVVMVDFWGDW